MPNWLRIAAATMAALYLAFIVALLVLGRKQDARAWAGFIPDCIVLFKRQLDDAIIVAFVLRTVLRGAGPSIVREHWPGPPNSLAVMLRLAGDTGDTAGR